MSPDTWKRLDAIFTESPMLQAGTSAPAVVDAAAADVGIPFPAAYREFVIRYGGAIVGPYSICGVKPAPGMGRGETVLEMTRRFRGQEWPGTEKWIVFSTDHGGNPVGFDASGVVWISDHDFGGVQKIADDFEDCIRRWCLSLPAGPERAATNSSA